MSNVDLEVLAQAALSNHIPSAPPDFMVRRLERDRTVPNVATFDWEVEYPDGTQYGGSVQLDEKGGGYSVCISMQYDPEKKWSWPHTWHHGFIEPAPENG